MKNMGIQRAAFEIGCSDWQLRRLDGKGVVSPVRDNWGRRLYGEDDVAAARKHLASLGRLVEQRKDRVAK
jgi:DNA-binding transcriptional MerR regulator